MELIEKQLAINAFMTATSDGDKADWCVDILKSLPTVQYDRIWNKLSKVYNMDAVPDEAKSIIGDVMLGLGEPHRKEGVRK